MTSIGGQSNRETYGTIATAIAVPPVPFKKRRIKPKEAGKSFLFTFIVVVVLAGVPLRRSCAPSSCRSRRPSRSASSTPRRTRRPSRRLRIRARPTTSTRSQSTGRRSRLRWSRRAASRASSSIPPIPTPAWSRGPDRGVNAQPAPWSLSPQWSNYADGLEPDRLSAAAVQHRCARADRDGRDGALVHARGLRVRPLPISGRGLLFTLLIATIFLPVRRHDHPDVHACS